MADKPAAEHTADPAPDHSNCLICKLKAALGYDHTPVMGEKNPANKEMLEEAGVGGALNRGISDGADASGH